MRIADSIRIALPLSLGTWAGIFMRKKNRLGTVLVCSCLWKVVFYKCRCKYKHDDSYLPSSSWLILYLVWSHNFLKMWIILIAKFLSEYLFLMVLLVEVRQNRSNFLLYVVFKLLVLLMHLESSSRTYRENWWINMVINTSIMVTAHPSIIFPYFWSRSKYAVDLPSRRCIDHK